MLFLYFFTYCSIALLLFFSIFRIPLVQELNYTNILTTNMMIWYYFNSAGQMAIIKSVGSHIASPFAHICNLSFSTGIFPSDMKTAKVTPIFKSDARDEFSNYRPISLLPNFSKILEKLMFNRITNFLNKYEILYEQQ